DSPSPQPSPDGIPLGEGESSSDGLTRRTIIPVQGFNARSFPWANSHPGHLPMGPMGEGESSSAAIE
ncbi:MAG TPA: hypothetical protein VMF08_04170, partial [Candidatus Sulfotelmatobacter sp.]|nr:hypothetical protein [Candidatus Sulfotelmatobacter sp.]